MPDVYPTFQHEDWQPPTATLYASYRVAGNRYWDGEKYAYGPITEGYRDALRYMKKMYVEELISPDYFTHTQETGIATIASGNAYMALSVWNGYPDGSNWGKDYPEQEWTLIPFFPTGDKVEKGDWMFFRGVTTPWRIETAYSRVISPAAKDVDALVKLLDYDYSPEMLDLHTYGVEGLNFYFDADGNKKFTEAQINGELKDSGLQLNGVCRAGIFPAPQNQSLAVVNQLNKPMPIYDIFTGTVVHKNVRTYATENLNLDYASPVDPRVVISSDEQTEYANVMNLVATVVAEWRVRFIKGESSLETDWDAYLAEVASMGDVEAMMEMYNQYLK